jgi:hypothetical protein
MRALPVIADIYMLHGQNRCRMAITLILLGAPLEDVELLRLLPWPFIANRIAVERKRLGLR